MADGNLGSLWFDLNVKTSEAKSNLKSLAMELSLLNLKTEAGKKAAQELFREFNFFHKNEIAEDFHNVAAQMAIQTSETAKLNARLKELAQLKADIVRRDKQSAEHGMFSQMQ